MVQRGLECNPPIKFSYGGVVSQTTGALSHSPSHASMVIFAVGLMGCTDLSACRLAPPDRKGEGTQRRRGSTQARRAVRPLLPLGATTLMHPD